MRAQREAAAQQQIDPRTLGAHDLQRFCEVQGLGVDYGKGTCVQMGGYSRGGGGVVMPNPDDLMERCRAMGRLPDYRKWTCM
jgi:hypothetical protein